MVLPKIAEPRVPIKDQLSEVADKNDWLTVAAVAVLAMCLATFDHEALGHGTACLLVHGHIQVLSSSLFRCDVKSGWIDPAGPAVNLLMGTLALLWVRFVRVQSLTARLFLILVTAFSYFWESGYAIRAMYRHDGDLYFFAEFLFGRVSMWQRWLAAGAGLALYILAARIVSDALLRLWPHARATRSVARIAWVSGTVSAGIAALAYAGSGWGDLRDAVLEIGGASFPLLFIPLRDRRIEPRQRTAFIERSPLTIAVSLVVYAGFVATLGRGIAAAPVAVSADRTPEISSEPSISGETMIEEDRMSAVTYNAPSPPSCLFAYGTLMKGESRHGLLERGQIKSIVPASVAGELIDFGEYPALRLSAYASGRVSGELIEFEALDTIISNIDDEEGPAFRREIVNVSLEDGRSHFAWTYVLASDTGHRRVIESGNWRARAAGR